MSGKCEQREKRGSGGGNGEEYATGACGPWVVEMHLSFANAHVLLYKAVNGTSSAMKMHAIGSAKDASGGEGQGRKLF